MKKIFSAFMAAALLAVTGCALDSAESKDTPVRTGKNGTMQGSITTPISLEDAFRQADLVADVTVTGWLGEDLEHSATFFSADVNKTLKGGEYKSIVFFQTGTSEWTFKVAPLHKKGDRFLLFFKETPEETVSFSESYENTYYALGAYAVVLDILEFENETFLLDRLNLFSHWLEEIGDIKKVDESTRDKLAETFNQADPVVAAVIAHVENFHKNAYKYDDIIAKIAELAKEAEK
jgi:hypothetical protein